MILLGACHFFYIVQCMSGLGFENLHSPHVPSPSLQKPASAATAIRVSSCTTVLITSPAGSWSANGTKHRRIRQRLPSETRTSTPSTTRTRAIRTMSSPSPASSAARSLRILSLQSAGTIFARSVLSRTTQKVQSASLAGRPPVGYSTQPRISRRGWRRKRKREKRKGRRRRM